MTAYRRPGTYINEVALTQSIQSLGLETSLAAFTGMALRGPVNTPVSISTWSDFTRRFGQFRSADGSQTYLLALAVYQFFANGGRGAWICRVAASDVASAQVQFQDSGQQTVLTVSAVDPGDWAVGQVYVQIADVNPSGAGGVAQGGDTFSLVVYSGGTAGAYLVERWTDLSLDPTATRYAPTVINGQSSWVTLSQGNVTGTLPPVPGAAVAMANPAGVTGSLDGTSTPTADAYTAAADAFDVCPSNLIFNIPDAYSMSSSDSTNIYNAFQIKADARGDSFVVVDVPKQVESTVAGAISWVNGINASGNVATYFPGIKVLNPVAGIGGTITVPPGGAVIGIYHSTDASRGVFKSPAGVSASISNAVDVALALTSTNKDDMNSAVKPVNAICSVQGAGICIMGARTLGGTRDLRFVGSRRTMLEIKKALNEAVQFAIFENNDSNLWTQVQTVCSTYLNGMWQAGGLKGSTPQDAYYVTCDATNNPQTNIDNGILTVEVGVALQSPAEYVIISIGQFDGETTVTDSTSSDNS